MADIGNADRPTSRRRSANWVRDGGTLVRFAGPRLAAATDALIPVRLRHGDRVLGGSLSWQTPQPLASFSEQEPVRRPDGAGRRPGQAPGARRARRRRSPSAPGRRSPTARRWSPPRQSGKGWLILFHVTADTSWSNLPLSGTFVDMLRRIIAFSTSVGERRRRRRGTPSRSRPTACSTATAASPRPAPRREPIAGRHRRRSSPAPSIRPASTAPRTASARSTSSTTNADAAAVRRVARSPAPTRPALSDRGADRARAVAARARRRCSSPSTRSPCSG